MGTEIRQGVLRCHQRAPLAVTNGIRMESDPVAESDIGYDASES
ncbi:hypothetical protein BEL01nite_72430 [Bradyrhizobium elkanii]|jgi:hypothetical protein|nr:hypothetical protein BEL01nite_72430 [Bradyrhizobium elkanii]